jgi:hypothetical protein
VGSNLPVLRVLQLLPMEAGPTDRVWMLADSSQREGYLSVSRLNSMRYALTNTDTY